MSRILQKIIYNQFFCDKVVKILREKRDLSETLVGVIGDLVPAERVVSFKFLSQLAGVSLKGKSMVQFVGRKV